MSVIRPRNTRSYARKVRQAAMATAGYIGAQALRGAGDSAYSQAHRATEQITPALSNAGDWLIRRMSTSSASNRGTPLARGHEGHTRYSLANPRRRRKRMRVGKTKYAKATKKLRRRVKPMVKRMIKKEFKYIPGPKMTMELFQKYAMNPTTGVDQNGSLSATSNNVAHHFVPLFTNDQMNAEFILGESGATETVTGGGFNRSGILDPGSLYDFVTNQDATNHIKDRELIMIDELQCTFYITNTEDTKVNLWVQEWVCNESTDVPLPTRVADLYNKQPFIFGDSSTKTITGYPTQSAVAADNIFKQPNFVIGKIGGVSKYWKKGSFKYFVELKPGESYHLKIPYKNIKWDKGKFYNENETVSASFEYHKGISRLIQLSVRGNTGKDSVTGESHFQACGVNWQLLKKLTAHRVDLFKVKPKQYLIGPYPNNLGGTQTNVPFGGTINNEARVDTGNTVISYVPDIQQTS